MNRKIIIIGGYLATGKSTFALRLSKETSIPYLIKDTFKSALCKTVELTHREESSRFSAITFDGMMYVTERLMEAGMPLIIEGNFTPKGIKKLDEAGIIKALIKKYNYESLTFKFKGDTQVLHKRFIEREKTPERGQANTMFYEPTHSEFDTFCTNLDSFNIGGNITQIDTTSFEAVDYDNHILTAKSFIASTY